jgi:hypothetical protein
MQFPNRRLVREEIYYTLPREPVSGFLALIPKFLKVLRYLNRGKPEPKVRRTPGSSNLWFESIKPDFRKNADALPGIRPSIAGLNVV